MIDLLAITLVLLMSLAGYRRGAVLTLVSLTAIALGAVVGAIIGAAGPPGAVPAGALVGAALGGLIVALRLERMHSALEESTVAEWVWQVDRAFGAVLNALLALTVTWTLGTVVALLPPREDGLTRSVRNSQIIKFELGVVSPVGPAATLMLRSGMLPGMQGPLVIVEAEDESVLQLLAVQRAAHSVVRVRGEACGQVATGTGWVIQPGFVVTNAHVVAGHEQTEVFPVADSASTLPATIVGIDTLNDVAVLRVSGLKNTPLPLHTDPQHGARAAIIGFPRTSGLSFAAARYDRAVNFTVRDIYEQNPTETKIVSFRGDVDPGSSGSPIVDDQGRVLATVTAHALSQVIDGGYAVPNDLVLAVMRDLKTSVSSGPCTAEAPS